MSIDVVGTPPKPARAPEVVRRIAVPPSDIERLARAVAALMRSERERRNASARPRT